MHAGPLWGIVRPLVVGGRRLTRRRIGAPGPGDFLPPSSVGGASQPVRLRLAVVGDVGAGRGDAHPTAAAMSAVAGNRPFDALVLLGDNVYPDGDPDGLDGTVFGPFHAVLRDGARLLPVLGNHDDRRGHAEAQVGRLHMPGRWYEARLGDVLFVGLDSNLAGDAAQQEWASSVLGGTDAAWKVVAMHHPPYSTGRHGPELSVRRSFTPLIEDHGVQLVLSGHEHDYQRFRPVAGTTYVVSGGAAHVRRTARGRLSEVAFATHHFVELRFYDDHLVLLAVDRAGRVFDQVTIRAGHEPVSPSASVIG